MHAARDRRADLSCVHGRYLSLVRIHKDSRAGSESALRGLHVTEGRCVHFYRRTAGKPTLQAGRFLIHYFVYWETPGK